MTLAQAYFLLAAILAVAGALPMTPAGVRALRAFPRSRGAAFVLFGAAAGWFLHGVSKMTEADLAGIPQPFMLGAFGAAALAAFRYLPDLLAVRGLAGLALLVSRPLLDAGFGKLPHSLALAVLVYAVLIFPALFYGCAPYRLREWIEKVAATPGRARAVGAAFLTLAATAAAFGFIA